ncbi:hypothetical protein HY798_04855 [Candidatus Falkowbacteria bacterium]|nr:hypothetical protein [Candidatus Falkowbacteria bacterium]
MANESLKCSLFDLLGENEKEKLGKFKEILTDEQAKKEAEKREKQLQEDGMFFFNKIIKEKGRFRSNLVFEE